MTQTTTYSALRYLDAAHTLPVPATMAIRVAVVFTKWSLRHRTRHALLDLDDHLLKDVGLERHAAHREARRMFWQG